MFRSLTISIKTIFFYLKEINILLSQYYQPEEITSADKTMALFSHLSIFIFSVFLPLIIYVAYNKKSRYVAFHSLQALYFQVMMYIVMVILIGVVIVLMFALGLDFDSLESKTFSTEWILTYSLIFGTGILYLLYEYGYSIFMAMRAFGGHKTKYPFVGSWAYKQIYEKPIQPQYQTPDSQNRNSGIYSKDTNPFD